MSKRHQVGLSLAVFVAVCIAELTRQLGTSSWNTIWAEDGEVYLNNAWNSHFPHGLTTPYAGYLQIVPRLLAPVIAVFPVAHAAALTALLGAGVAALASTFVFLASGEVIRALGLRIVVAVAPAVLSITGLELLANLTNLHWYLIYASFWALVWRKSTTARTAAAAVVIAAATLTDPLTALYAPLALGLCVYRRRAQEVLILAVLAGCSVVQLVFAGNDVASTAKHPFDLAPIFGYHVAGSLVVGDRFVPGLWSRFGYGSIVVATLLVATCLVWAWRRSSHVNHLWMSAAIAYSLGFFIVPMMVRGTAPVWPPVSPGAETRYFFLPVVFIVAAFCIGIDGAGFVLRTARGRRWPYLALLGWAAVVAVVNYGVVNSRSEGPSWSTQVLLARAACASGAAQTAQLQLSPGPPWVVEVPCRDLR